MYINISQLYAVPSVAREGDVIQLLIRLENLTSTSLHAAATSVVNGSQLPIFPDYFLLPGGEEYTFGGSFIMPGSDVEVWAYAYCWDGSQWVHQISKSITVQLLSTPVSQLSEFAISDYSKL